MQDLRTTRDVLQSLLRATQAAATQSASAPPGGAPPGMAGGDPTVAVVLPSTGREDTQAARGAPAAGSADPVMPLEDLYRQGYRDYTKGNYALALLELEEFANRYPTSELADDARYFIGEVHFGQENYHDAVESFDQVVQAYPGGDKAGPAYLKKGLALLELNRTADAVIQLQHVITTYPKSEEARIARDRLRSMGLSER